VVKLGMLQDEKFYTKAKELLIWKNCQGEWKQLDADKEKPVLYCEAGQEGSSLTKAYLAKEMTVLVASCPLDHPLMSRLEKEDGYQFRRIDALLDDTLLDSTKEKTILDANGRTEGAKIADFFRSALKDSQIDVDAKSIALETLPALLTLEENQRRFRDYMNRMGEVSPQMQPKATLIVNTNSPLVQAAYKAKEIAPEVARDIAQHILELTRISHHELPQNEMHDFIQRTTNLLEKLTAKLT
jgi:molecular chaperone HtpG